MSLTTEEVLLIYKEVMLDLPPTLDCPEAQEVRARITAERREAQEKGWIMEVPFELGDI